MCFKIKRLFERGAGMSQEVNHYEESFHELNNWLRENYPGVHKHMLRDSIKKNNEEVQD